MSYRPMFLVLFNPIALRKTKIVYYFGLSECNLVHVKEKKILYNSCLAFHFLFYSYEQFNQNEEKK